MLTNTNFFPNMSNNFKDYIRTIPDFPKEGIAFKDISPLLASPEVYRELISTMSQKIKESGAGKIVGLESRGFILGNAIAQELSLPFIMARKPGKLPGDTIGQDYALEYGTNRLELQIDAVHAGEKVAIVDDLLATGGTAKAAYDLLTKVGASVTLCAFAIELSELNGREQINDVPSYSVITY